MSHDATDDAGAEEGSRGMVTALVVLRPAPRPGGRAPGPPAPPSRETLSEFTPSDDEVASTAAALRGLGFDVGPFLGNSMSITAPVERVEALFGVRLVGGDAVWTVEGDGPGGAAGSQGEDQELPTGRLEAPVAAAIERILLEPPMELHEPDEWMP